MSAGREASAAAGPGAGLRFEVGLSSLGSGSVCSVGSVCGGKVSSRDEGPGSWSSAESVQVPLKKKGELSEGAWLSMAK